MEYLTRCLMELKQNRLFHFHPRCKRFGLTHVCFADDLLLFTRGDISSVQQLMKILDKFAAASGLKANQLKSCIYFGGVGREIKQEILRTSGMVEGQLPFKYLGVPLSSQKLSIMQCQPLVQKIISKINCWSTKLLSYAGRVQLIKAVLFGIQVYWSQVFILPQKVLKMVQTACRIFLWTGKADLSRRSLVAWEKVMMPHHAGGLNIINLKMWNRAAICKLLWSLNQKKDRIWIRWVHGYYIKHRDVYNMEQPKQSSWIIRKIIGANDYLRETQRGREWIQTAEFSIKKVYRAFMGTPQRMPWAKMMCQNGAPPKCLFISWLLLHERLATYSYLQKIGIHVDQMCCLCGTETEELDHLFFDCAITRAVWKEVTEWGGIQRQPQKWCNEKDYLVTQCTTNSGKQRLYRCTISVIVYHIWKERNQRRMQGSQSSVEAMVLQCKNLLAWCSRNDKKLARLLVNT